MTQNGKGSKQRPAAITTEEYISNYERTFARREPPIEYIEAVRGGMFFELFPHLTGVWELDKPLWNAP